MRTIALDRIRLLLITFLLALSTLNGDWSTEKPKDETKSIPFSSSKYGFTCPSITCLQTFPKDMHTYVHFMVGTNHISFFPLTVLKLCDLIQNCLIPKHFKVTLHVSEKSVNQNSFISLFQRLDIPFQIWNGTFTSTNKMMHYLNTYKWSSDPSKFFYHTDLDEIPDAFLLSKALLELTSGACDAIRAIWRERVTIDGTLLNVSLDSLSNLPQKSNSLYSTAALCLYDSFPLRCNISANYMAAFTTRKIIVYRSNLRLTSGQHDVWCDKPMKNSDSSQQSWIFKQACMKHITSTRERYDRSIPPVEIYQSLPIISRRPVICKTTVVLDHFKFVGGIEDYLLLRAQQYKAKGLHWWAQSKALVDFVQRNDGKVCVSCPENHCDVTRLDEVTV